MGDRDEEDRRRTGGGWVTPGGEIRSDCLFWTSPRIRSFAPIRPLRRDPGDLFLLDTDGRPSGGDAPQ